MGTHTHWGSTDSWNIRTIGLRTRHRADGALLPTSSSISISKRTRLPCGRTYHLHFCLSRTLRIPRGQGVWSRSHHRTPWFMGGVNKYQALVDVFNNSSSFSLASSTEATIKPVFFTNSIDHLGLRSSRHTIMSLSQKSPGLLTLLP